MFYQELRNIYNEERTKSSKPATELANLLVIKYRKEGPRFNNIEKLAIALTNVLGNLFLKLQTNNYINKSDGNKYNNNHIPQLALPLNNNLFGKNKYDVKKYKIVYKNIDTFGLTKRNIHTIKDILNYFNICTTTKGNYSGKSTTVKINDIMEWREDIFNVSIAFNLSLYHCVIKGNYKPSWYNEKPNGNFNTYIKVNKKKIATSEAISKMTDQINSLWTEGLEKFHYKRVFNKNDMNGGRFYSPLSNMSKVHRKRIILNNLGYKEIDFTAFVPNVMKLFADGEYFDERPYNKVSKQILKDKARNKSSEVKQSYLSDYENILSDALKKPILAIMNQDYYKDKTINKSKALWGVLRSHALANTPEEMKACSDIIDNAIKASNLYNLREQRWKVLHGDDIPCPHFYIKPSNLLSAMKKSLKEIDNYLLSSNWGWTQFIESEVLIAISSNLKEDNLLPLYLHDAFFVPEGYYEKYKTLSEEYLKEIVKDYREAILNEDANEKVKKDITDLLLSSRSIKKYISTAQASFKTGELSKNHVKTLTMKIIKILKKERSNFDKKGINKFYFSHNITDYWKLYWLINDNINTLIQTP